MPRNRCCRPTSAGVWPRTTVHLFFDLPGDAKEEVYRVILRALEGPGAASSTRARYVDMPRLLDSLRTGRTASTKMARQRDHALAFLDGF